MRKKKLIVDFERRGDEWFDAEMLKAGHPSSKSKVSPFVSDWPHEFEVDFFANSADVYEQVRQIVSKRNDGLDASLKSLEPWLAFRS